MDTTGSHCKRDGARDDRKRIQVHAHPHSAVREAKEEKKKKPPKNGR